MQQCYKKYLKYCLAGAAFLPISNSKAQTTANNYIVTYMPRVPVRTANTLQSATVSNVNQTVQYYDGLGRLNQTVITKGSTTQRDMVQPVAYDQYNREAAKYLPYADSANSTNYGSYKATALTDQASFYSNPTSSKWSAPGVVTTPYPTSVTNFEPSPLNRPLEQGFAGDNWQLTGTVGPTNPGHTLKTVYASNDAGNLTSGDGYWVQLYTVVFSYPVGQYDYRNSLANSGAYPANTLFVTVAKNENWLATQSDPTLNTTQEYKDLFGRVVVKRTINYNVASSSRQVLSTYYVYDEYDNLVYVLPPGVNPDNGGITQAQLDNQCYQYRYDGRNRMIYKKIPGKGWQFIIYNNINQAIATQDSVQRMANPQQVSYIKYDSQGRPIVTGFYTISGSPGADNRSTLQASANAETTYWETKSSSGVYSNVTIPTTGATILTTSYYDDYNVSGMPSTYTLTSGVSVMTRGLMTVTQTAVLNTSTDLLWSAHYYDHLGRNVKSYAQHYLGGHSNYSTNNYDLVTNYYNFTNQVDTTIRQHYTKANTTTPKVAITNVNTYDQVGRKLTTTAQITGANGTPQATVTLSTINYNQVGQVYSKKIGGALQTIVYAYNERGWLTSLTPQVTSSYGGNYAESIYYNNPTGAAAPQYNGNISQFIYNSPYMETGNSKSSSSTNTVNYTYDNLNRLTQSQSTLAKTDETITYDTEGNINSLVRSGSGINTGSLGYTYFAGTNQLNSMTENGTAFKQYSYDGNGNAVSDSTTKRLTYNLMNLPQVYTLNGATKATYYYDAGGNKLRDVSATYGTWDYIGVIVYMNERINFVQTEEGQAVLMADSIYHYNYNLLDYLGNVRETFNNGGTGGAIQTIQENDYYPFGLAIKTYDYSNNNRYLYNGKEEQYDLTNQYDYGARFYNPVIARWTVVDPLAEVSRRWSPYSYGENNPIRNVDVDGMWTDNGEGGQTTTDPDEIAAELGYLQGQVHAKNAQAQNNADFADNADFKHGSDVSLGVEYEENTQTSSWPTVNNVISKSDFVPHRTKPDGTDVSCLKLGGEQLAKAGYEAEEGDANAIHTYSDNGVVDLKNTATAVSYINGELQKGIPVLVGVDAFSGRRKVNFDGTTDHFVVIVGSGTDAKGAFYRFYDNSTANVWDGTSNNNKLYYNKSTGMISGNTDSGYGSLPNSHPYIMSQVRKSISKRP